MERPPPPSFFPTPPPSDRVLYILLPYFIGTVASPPPFLITDGANPFSPYHFGYYRPMSHLPPILVFSFQPPSEDANTSLEYPPTETVGSLVSPPSVPPTPKRNACMTQHYPPPFQRKQVRAGYRQDMPFLFGLPFLPFC